MCERHQKDTPIISYVLITPAKNEAKYIPETIKSVTTQTLRPVEWIIVNDGSTDGTEKIVREASEHHPWIKLVSRSTHKAHSFDAVVQTAECGIQHISKTEYAYLGLIDADIRFKKDYFSQLIKKMEKNPRIGLAGGMVIDTGTRNIRIPRNRKDVPGATQFFRRECFEAIGGLIAVPAGGWDMLTCAQARMVGYDTKLYLDLIVEHLKPRNVSQGSMIKRIWNMGVRDHALGYHPIFEVVKCMDRLREAPRLFGALVWFCGYIFASVTRQQRIIPKNLLHFIRSEQLKRIKAVFSRTAAIQ